MLTGDAAVSLVVRADRAAAGGLLLSICIPLPSLRCTSCLLLLHLMDFAREKGIEALYLETGSMAFFEPARQLYARHGFEFCGPFADYTDDPNSCFMMRLL